MSIFFAILSVAIGLFRAEVTARGSSLFTYVNGAAMHVPSIESYQKYRHYMHTQLRKYRTASMGRLPGSSV
jgi:hypothetical protein